MQSYYPSLRNTERLMTLLIEDKRSVHTKRAYKNDIIYFFKELTGSGPNNENLERFLSLPKIEALELVFRYKNKLIQEGKSESTVNRKLAAVRSFVSLAKTLGYCDFDLKEIKYEKVQSYRDTTGISLEQFQKVLKNINRNTLKGKRDYAILQLLFETAIRRNELASITIGDYDPEDYSIWILGKGKGTQKEKMTISKQVIRSIHIYLEERKQEQELSDKDPLFATTDRRTRGSKMSGEAIRRVVRDAGYKAGIEKPLSPHKIRHSAITIALDKTNGDVRAVRKLSRHKKIDTLLVYDDNRENKQGEITNLLSTLYS